MGDREGHAGEYGDLEGVLQSFLHHSLPRARPEETLISTSVQSGSVGFVDPESGERPAVLDRSRISTEWYPPLHAQIDEPAKNGDSEPALRLTRVCLCPAQS